MLIALALASAVPLSLKQVDPSDTNTEINNGQSPGPSPPNNSRVEELPANLGGAPPVNSADSHWPVPPAAQYAFKESSEQVASPPIVDSQNKSVHGVHPDPVTFDRPEEIHPTEVKTPLGGEWPCDPNLVVDVSVPAAKSTEAGGIPMLPAWYGCSDEYEVGREKASPEVSWTNIAGDATEFSLQLISMGSALNGDSCPGTGPEAGKILWHVVGINTTSPTVTLKEGASHDKRMLYGGTEEPNQWLEEYYSGPCPKPGVTECYRFKVLAHRQNGWCQCGHKDVLFHRVDKVEYVPWTYNGTTHYAPASQ